MALPIEKSKNIEFEQAIKTNVKAKIGLMGPSGSGKTFSALRLATGIVEGNKIAFVDTENGSASLYANRFKFDVINFHPPFTPDKYIRAIDMAIEKKYDILVIDSISQEWTGEGGILEMKAEFDAQGGNQFANWKIPSLWHGKFLNKIILSNIHIICCMRTKQEYIIIEDERGRKVPKRVGLAPIQREGVEYEFTFVFEIGYNHIAKATKDKVELFGDTPFQITEDIGKKITDWLKS